MPTYRKDLHLGRKTPVLGTDDIDNSAITTDKIADEAVTAAKIADRNIGGGHIIDGVIEARHLNEESIKTWIESHVDMGSDCACNVRALSRAEYEAITSPDPDVYYFIIEDEEDDGGDQPEPPIIEDWVFGMAMPIVLS